MQQTATQREIGRQNASESNAAGLAQKRPGPEKRRQQSRESRKLQRDPARRRNYSFSPDRRDSLVVKHHHQHPVPPLPDNAAALAGRSMNLANMKNGRVGAREQDEAVGRVPTLHKRSARDLNRRKSSKKRKEDHDRVAELKAMSKHMPPPSRASTTPEWSGRPMSKDTKRMHGLNRIFASPASDVSLPTQESLHSAMFSDSEQYTSYELKGIDLFAPHPTIRYAENPHYRHYESSFGAARSNSKRKRVSEKEPMPEETAKSRQRIDDLADDLDAGALRELMERDQRRRERKRISDQEKMARKLAQRREKQKAEEDQAIILGREPPKNMERGVLGRELMGLGIGTGGPVQAMRRDSEESSRRSRRMAHVTQKAPESTAHIPGAESVKSGSLPGAGPTSPTGEREEPVVAIPQAAQVSHANISPPASLKADRRDVSSTSQMKDLAPPLRVSQTSIQTPPREDTPVEVPKPDASRRSSETGSSRHHSSGWKSWFKRNSKDKRSSGQSSFSNTTRESIIGSQPPAVVYTSAPLLNSGIPKRTMSRFREDLPELPLSPPDSRVQSPEADIVPPVPASLQEKTANGRISVDAPPAVRRYDTPPSRYRSAEHGPHLRYETPTAGRRSAEDPSPELSNMMSQSLASIDSEGSWLSGRPRASSKRSSVQKPLHPSRESHSSLQKRYREFSDSAEDLGIAEDEYFSRLTPGPDDVYVMPNRHNRVSGNPMPSSDEEDEESFARPASKSKWGEIARTPTVVYRELRAQSRQGVLSDFLDDDSGDEGTAESPLTPVNRRDDESEGAESPTSPVGEVGGLRRATSVDYKKAHVRAISAGSAKLLDLKPRVLAESKRASIS
jgi:hypothetical protein